MNKIKLIVKYGVSNIHINEGVSDHCKILTVKDLDELTNGNINKALKEEHENSNITITDITQIKN